MTICEDCKLNNREKYDECKPYQGVCDEYLLSILYGEEPRSPISIEDND